MDVHAMRVLVGLSLYLVAVAAVGSAAATLYSAIQPGAGTAAPRHEAVATPSLRVQASMERKAEDVALAEKARAASADNERAAAAAEREQAEAPSTGLMAPLAPNAAQRPSDYREKWPADRERAAQVREIKREARRRLRQLEAPTVYSYAPQRRRGTYPAEFLRRDRSGD
jgi:hypothetical protein